MLGACPSNALRQSARSARRGDLALAPEVVAVELDRLGALLEPEHDRRFAGPAAAERDCFLDMIADRGALRARRNLDMNREQPFSEDRLIGPGHRDEIPSIDGACTGRGGTTLAHDNNIERQTHRVARAVAFGLDLTQQ